MEYKPRWETWLGLSEVSAEQPLREALGRPHVFLVLPGTRSKSAAKVALFLRAGRVQYGRPGEEEIHLPLTTAQTWLQTKAEPEAKRRVMSPGLRLCLPTDLCPPGRGGPTLRVEHSISALSKAFCRDSTVALRSSRVSRRLSMMPWLSRFSLSGAGMGVGEGRGPTAHQREDLALWLQRPTPESQEGQVLGRKVGGAGFSFWHVPNQGSQDRVSPFRAGDPFSAAWNCLSKDFPAPHSHGASSFILLELMQVPAKLAAEAPPTSTLSQQVAPSQPGSRTRSLRQREEVHPV